MEDDKGCTYSLSRKVEKKIVTQQKTLQNNFPSEGFLTLLLLNLPPTMVFVNMYFLKLHMLVHIFLGD
jgi:hypothetical protein